MEHEAAAIRAAFAACNLEVESDALGACVTLCSELSLSPDEFAAQWDAYSMNNQLAGAADRDNLVGFRSSVVQQRAKAAKSSSSSGAGIAQKRRFNKMSASQGAPDKLDSIYSMRSPEPKSARPFASPPSANKVQRTNGLFSPTSLQSPPGNTYEQRTDAGKVVSEFNAHLKKEVGMHDADEAVAAKVDVPYPERNLGANISFMYTPPFQRAIALDEQLTEYEELVKTHYKLEELKAVGDPSPALVTVVGRIVCEAAEGKLNPSVVQLEGSRKTCGGQRVLLDLSSVPSFQIFPGKIVALEGIFPDIRSPMAVKRFLEPIPAPVPTSKKAEIREIQSANGGKPLRVVTACGPFTTTNNVEYLPLNDLLEIVANQKPDVLILVGPFIDTMHSMFQDGLVEYDGMMVSFEDVFLLKVMARLNNIMSKFTTLQVILVPSLRDANHDYVYPQPPFNKKKACEAFESPEYAKRVHMMPNPCTFSINGVVFGTSSLDIVVQLSSNELHRAQSRDQNRLLRLCEQVVDQRSYYPIFPPPPNSGAPLDLRFMKNFQFEETPDILLLPSILNRFCGRVKDSICVNPGQLCKGESGGTFAVVTVLPLPSDKLDATPGEEIGHFVPDRTFVEIKRI